MADVAREAGVSLMTV
ncbi:MAG: LacI family DNA-binding transcriptional regulator, partial [Anaerolineae bacterium]|nr:LacI family DNA-binding transcriptional regulator [Anaerolineae bacterium]